MESHRLASIICVVALYTILSVNLAEANQYFVGGSKDIGWNDKPKKLSYNHWSKKTKFLVGDTIVFTYPLGKDTVLYVREEDYKSCNNKNPVKTWNDGKTEVNLFETGIYHFIGGNDGSCQKGQRLIVFVPEIQSPPEPHTPAASPLSPPAVPSTPPPTPSPAPHTPAASPLSPPAVPSTPPTPSPAPRTPAASPLSPPSVPSTPPPTPSPAPHTPAASPLSPPAVPSTPPPTQISPSPVHTPVASPSPLSPPPVPSSTPPPTQTPPPSAAHTPAASPSPLFPPTPPPTQKAPSLAPSISHPPESSPPPSPPTPSSPAPQPSEYAPAPAPSSAWSIATQSMLTPLVGLLFGVLFH